MIGAAFLFAGEFVSSFGRGNSIFPKTKDTMKLHLLSSAIRGGISGVGLAKTASILAVLSTAILSAGIAVRVAQADTIVQFDLNGSVNGTNGPVSSFQVQLFDSQAPITVANFVRYVDNRLYDNTIIHRNVQDFVMQGGGFTPKVTGGIVTSLDQIATYGAIQNEFSSTRSNIRGTIAMAQLANAPNSATSQWFVNLNDNSHNLDVQNGGFTVFGQVIGDGMTLIDDRCPSARQSCRAFRCANLYAAVQASAVVY